MYKLYLFTSLARNCVSNAIVLNFLTVSFEASSKPSREQCMAYTHTLKALYKQSSNHMYLKWQVPKLPRKLTEFFPGNICPVPIVWIEYESRVLPLGEVTLQHRSCPLLLSVVIKQVSTQGSSLQASYTAGLP